jgi:hypothetical protein
MFDFSKIINWSLKKGSHPFPGPDGGTCINEAAIIAAGFEYKSVGSAKDCPPCFSRVIAQYAIYLNDKMPDAFRNELLMPFVTRLSGTADTKEIEKKRMEFIVLETVRQINAYLCRKVMKREDFAGRCEAIKTLSEVRPLMQKIKKAYAAAAAADAAAFVADGAAYAAAAADAAAFVADGAAYAAAAADAAAFVADAAAFVADAERKKIWSMAADILDGAIRLGNQAKPEDTAVIVERLEAAKKRAKVAA